MDKVDNQPKTKNILLADDDEDDIDFFTDALCESQIDCHVQVARNGQQVIDALNAEPAPDLIILDLNMPLCNGFECIQQIKSRPLLAEIPVVYLSTSSDPGNVDKARLLGAQGYITKPHTFKGYQSMVMDLLSNNWQANAKTNFYQFKEKRNLR